MFDFEEEANFFLDGVERLLKFHKTYCFSDCNIFACINWSAAMNLSYRYTVRISLLFCSLRCCHFLEVVLNIVGFF